MLLTIHNLPVTTRYGDIKSLLQAKCGLTQFILDNMVVEGVGKKVTVGVAEDADAAILVRKINGLYWNGQQLYVEAVRQQKNASEQPYRSNVPPAQETEQSFSMNLQQHSSYPGQGILNPAPVSQPMYYIPSYTSEHIMQANYMSQTYDQTQKVQNAYMGSGDVQPSIPQVGAQYNQNFSGSDQNQSSYVSYNNEEDFIGKMPHYGQHSPDKKREVDWVPNRRESPPRVDHGQSWAGQGARPKQADYRPNRPADQGFNKPRPDFRVSNPPSLLSLPAASEFNVNDQARSNRFSGSREFTNVHQHREQRERFADRSNKFEQNVRRGPNDFSVRPNERSGNSEFTGRPNQFTGRPNERRENNAFSGGPNQYFGRPNERRGPNEFAGAATERGRPNDSATANERRGTNNFSERPNERRGVNDFSGRQKEFSARPNERQRPNEHQFKPNELPGRNWRPNDRPDLAKPNREFGRSNERDTFNRSTDRAEFSRRDRPERNSRFEPETRKRKFDDRFDEIERPKRISRPQPSRPNNLVTQYDAKPKPGRKMFINAVKKIVYDMKNKLGIQKFDLATRQAFKQLVTDRLDGLLDGRPMPSTLKYYQVYRSMYPEMGDKTTYKTVLAMVSKTAQPVGSAAGPSQAKPASAAKPAAFAKPAAAARPTTFAKPAAAAKPTTFAKPAAAAKPTTFAKPAPPTLNKAKKEGDLQTKAEENKAALPKKMTKGEREALRRQKEAQSLLAQGKLPTFPQGDKRLVAQQRKEEKEGHIPEVDAPYKRAIEEEVNKFAELFMHELDNAPTPKLQRAYNTVERLQLAEEIKQHLILPLSRRISNTGMKVVRIYGYPKLPTRAVLEKALFKLGVQSLRKSQKAKMYTAALDTYDGVDKLCAMDGLQLEGTAIMFKPFHLPIREKADLKLLNRMRKKIISDMIEKTEINLLDKDWPEKEAEIKAKQAEAAKVEAEAAKVEAEAAKVEAEAAKVEATQEDKGELNDTVQDSETAINDSKNATSDYIEHNFQVIDEVNETDSDIELAVDKSCLNSENCNVDESNDNIADNKGDVEENNGDVEENNTDFGDNNGDAGENNGEVEENKGEGKENKGDVEENKGDVEENNGDIEENNDEAGENDGEQDNGDVEVNDNDVMDDSDGDNELDLDNVDVDDDDLEDY